MQKNDSALILSIHQGREYVKCLRSDRVKLTRVAMRLADRADLSPEYVAYAVGFLSCQLQLEDWSLDQYDSLDRALRSTKANRLPYELRRYDDLSGPDKRRRLYDAIRPNKGDPLDPIQIMREAAKDLGVDVEAFAARHGLDLTARPATPTRPGAISEEVHQTVTNLNEFMRDSLPALLREQIETVNALREEVTALREEARRRDDQIAVLIDAIKGKASDQPANVVQMPGSRPAVRSKLATMRERQGQLRPVGGDH